MDTLATQPGEHSFALFVVCCLVCANKANLYNDVSNDSRSCQFFSSRNYYDIVYLVSCERNVMLHFTRLSLQQVHWPWRLNINKLNSCHKNDLHPLR